MGNPDDPKHKVWSEGRDESKAAADDMMAGLGFEDMDQIQSTTTRRGVIMTGNCSKCGWQYKAEIGWPEIACMYLGEQLPSKFKQSGDATPTRQGVIVRLKHNCGGVTQFLIPWGEIDSYVSTGVRSGSLNPQIYRAAAAKRRQQGRA